jgi:hypothetical protein
MEYIVKVGRLGSKAVVDAIAVGDEKRTSFDLTMKDYISEGNLPASPVEDSEVTPAATQKIQDIFISAGRLSDLGDLLKLKVIQKLAPGISKEGYEETQETGAASTARQEERQRDRDIREPERPAHDPLRHEPPPARPHPFQDPNVGPLRPNPDGLDPPGFDDEYDLLRGPRGGVQPGRSPFGIGHDDLYPPGMGPNDPFRGPGGGLPRPGGGGMHPTFDDPLFGGGAGMRGDPQVPGGARYDPVGPGDPRGGPRGFPGAGHRGPGGAPHNPFGGFGGGDFI